MGLLSFLKVEGDSKKKLKEPDSRNRDLVVKDQFQIFVKTLARRLVTIRVWVGHLEDFKQKIEEKLGISANLQSLIYAGKSVKEGTKLQDYGTEHDSIVFLN